MEMVGVQQITPFLHSEHTQSGEAYCFGGPAGLKLMILMHFPNAELTRTCLLL